MSKRVGAFEAARGSHGCNTESYYQSDSVELTAAASQKAEPPDGKARFPYPAERSLRLPSENLI